MIREAEEKDLDDILAIYNDAILNTTAIYTYKIQTIEEKRLWLEEKNNNGYPVLVYEECGKILGFATYGPFRAWPAYKYTVEHSVYVNVNDRGRGIGTLLLKEIIKKADEKRYATIVAGIDSKNETSIKIHEEIGFEYSGKIKRAGYKFGGWLDLVFYQLNLDGPEIPRES